MSPWRVWLLAMILVSFSGASQVKRAPEGGAARAGPVLEEASGMRQSILASTDG